MCVALALAPEALAQEPIGRPLIHNFERADVVSEQQHWDVAQDARGVMFFANNAGVLEYDGHSWRLIALPSAVDVRSVAIAADGKGPVYIGASGDFGRLEADEIGQWRFVSLLPPDARDDPSFDQRFAAAITPSGGVYFKGTSTLCYYERELHCRARQTIRSPIFATGRELYVQQTDLGLMELVGGETTPVPDGQQFTNAEIAMVLASPRTNGDALIVGTRDFRFFVRRGRSFEPLPSDARDADGDDSLTGGALLPDGTIALATMLRGVLIMDETGRVRQRIDRRAGLRDNHVLALLTDRQGGLWAGLQHGLSRIVVSPQFSVFDERSGLERGWREVVEYGGTLYARGDTGLYAASLSAPATRATASASRAPLREDRRHRSAGLGIRRRRWTTTRVRGRWNPRGAGHDRAPRDALRVDAGHALSVTARPGARLRRPRGRARLDAPGTRPLAGRGPRRGRRRDDHLDRRGRRRRSVGRVAAPARAAGVSATAPRRHARTPIHSATRR